ncbi:MAG: hypothetical protein K0R82_2287, partial [Flavipsychrobacter sp.]|nr:hypothetical protein [Flavipsychrobacter sp.]
MARLLLSILSCLCFLSLKAQPTARAQFVNNTADNALTNGIDVYIDGNLAINDLDYRS